MADAASPVEAASQSFSMAARQLQESLPSIQEVGESYIRAQSVLEQAHRSLQTGTEGYVRSQSQVREMLDSLRESHVLAVQKISQGVDDAVLKSMKVAGTQLEKITTAQSQSLQAWERSSAAIQNAVGGLQNAAQQISGFAEEMREASEPTVRASGAFLEAAEKLQDTIPTLTDVASVHAQSRELMGEAMQSLQSGKTVRFTESTDHAPSK